VGILQGLLAWLRKSASKIVQAIFGWAVRALFGTPEESEKTMLSAVVASAAAWPLLLIGIPFPKIAAFVIAFVPIPKWVPSGWIRGIWIALAVAVPVGVGIALASRGAARQRRSAWSTALHGFPVTAALSMAFLTAFLTSPIRRMLAAAKRREDVTIPLLLGRDHYAAAAETIRESLEQHDLPTRRGEPPWILTAPSRVLRALGGSMLRDRIPRELCFYRGEAIDVVVNPNGVTLQAQEETAARAHALISEMATLGPGLQTTDSNAQRIERRLKDVVEVFERDRSSHTGSTVLLERLDEIGRELEHTQVPFDDWQVLYREILQMARAIRGRPQILGTERRHTMEEERRPRAAWPPRPARSITAMSTPQLVAGLTTEVRELARKEVELAKAELRVDIKAEAKSVTWFAVAAILGICFVNMLFVAAALLVARWLDPPIAALAVAGLLLVLAVIFGLVGKAALVKPMETTRRTLNESWTWAKNRIA